MNTVQSQVKQTQKWDNQHFVHPWESMEDLGQNTRLSAERAEGIYFYNDKGQRFIDGPGGMWCVQIGYGNEEMIHAITEQTRNLPYFSPFNNTNSTSAKLAHKLSTITPGDLNSVFFTTGGSTAVDTAIRFVQFRNNVLGKPEKKSIISRQEAYHGSTYLSASLSGKMNDREWVDCAEFVHLLPDVNFYKAPKAMSMNDFLEEKVEDLEQAIIKLGADNVAAFIAEPVLSSGGVIVPPAGYHKQCLDICRKHDVLYISDEVVTGFGRLGHWFASESEFDIMPDIITCAKGLTSGYLPLGACIISDQLLEEISGKSSQQATFSNGFTYSGHPVCAIAALKNIEIIEREGILEHVQNVAPLFQKRLAALEDFPIIGDARGKGLVGCIECIDSDNGVKDDLIASKIDLHCQELGLIVRPIHNMCVFSPPLIITESQINEMFDILTLGIKRTMDGVVQDSRTSTDADEHIQSIAG